MRTWLRNPVLQVTISKIQAVDFLNKSMIFDQDFSSYQVQNTKEKYYEMADNFHSEWER